MTFGMDVFIAGQPDFNLLPVALTIFAAGLAAVWFRSRNLWHLFFAAIFGVYLLFAIDAVFFPIRLFPGYALSLRAILGMSNFVPFNYDFSFIPHMVWRQIFENILLTVPFGFGVSFVMRLKPRHFLWLIPAVGFGIGLTQFLIMVLIWMTRVITIDDIILNGLGVAIGYLLFRVFAWLYVCAAHRLGLPRSGLFGYVYDVSVRASGPERLPEPAAP